MRILIWLTPTLLFLITVLSYFCDSCRGVPCGWKDIFWSESLFSYYMFLLITFGTLRDCRDSQHAPVVSSLWRKLMGASLRRCRVPRMTMPAPSRPRGTGLIKSYRNSSFFPSWKSHSVLFFLMAFRCLNGICILENLVFLYVLRFKK